MPVLVITSSVSELGKVHKAFLSDPAIPASEVSLRLDSKTITDRSGYVMPMQIFTGHTQVLRFSQFDDKGRSLKKEWQTLIDDATKRLGSADDNRCHITITDGFGGRGHDFQVRQAIMLRNAEPVTPSCKRFSWDVCLNQTGR